MPLFADMDFETVSALNLTQVGAWRYAEDLSTDVLCLCLSTSGGIERDLEWRGTEEGRGVFHEQIMYLLEEGYIFRRFGQFETAIWNCIMVPRWGFPEIPADRWEDVQAVGAMLNMPKSLDKLAKALQLPIEKDLEGRKITLKLSEQRRKGKLTPELLAAAKPRVVQYCWPDVRIMTQAMDLMGHMDRGERESWLLYEKINRRGLRIDLGYVRAAQKIRHEAREPLVAEFSAITGLEKPSQREKFLAWLHANGAPLPDLQRQTLEEVLDGDIEPDEDEEGDQDDDAFYDHDDAMVGAGRASGGRVAYYRMDLPARAIRALRIRQAVENTSLKKYDTMFAAAMLDGRARGLLLWHGTGPGRATASVIQPHNFPRPALKADKRLLKAEFLKMQVMTGSAAWVEEVYGKETALKALVTGIRHGLIPGKGKVFCSGDYAGIQARVVLAMAGQEDRMAVFRRQDAGDKTADIYCDMATQIFKHPVLKEEHPEKRQTGKNAVLGLGFSLRAEGFQEKFARKETLDFCELVVHTYRDEWAPKVPKLWNGLHDAAKSAVRFPGRVTEAFGVEYRMNGDWLEARVPTGGRVWYYCPRLIRRPAPWDENKLIEALVFTAQKMGAVRQVTAHRGLLTENAVMRTEVDLIQAAEERLEAAGFEVVLDVHDEILSEVDEARADEKAYRQIMEDVQAEARAMGVPIAVETWVGGCYRK